MVVGGKPSAVGSPMAQEHSVFGGTPSPIDVSKSLKGLDFPVGRDEIIAHAERKRCEERVIDALRRLPDREYDDMSEVMQGYEEVT